MGQLTREDVLDLLTGRYGFDSYSIIGDELTCSCPFTGNHPNGDAHPSFGIDLEKGLYNCFSCGAKGNMLRFIMDMEDIDSHSASLVLNKYASELSPEQLLKMLERGEYVPRSAVTPIHAEVQRWAANEHPYWATRGLTKQTIAKYRLGYDASENRVTIPHYFDGQLVGYLKRALGNDKPKYKNSTGFPKKETLFNLDVAKQDTTALLVEAALSVIWLDQCGVHNAVASFGASLSNEQAVLLRMNFNSVIIWYDPDEAGRKETRNVIKMLSPFVNVFVVDSPRGDPNELSEADCLDTLNYCVPSFLLGR